MLSIDMEKKKKKKKIWTRYVLGLVVLILVLLSYAVGIEPYWIEVTVHDLRLPGKGEPVRIVQLSDLHLQSIGRRERSVVEQLQQIEPDLIVLSGDVIVQADDMLALDRFLAMLGTTPKVAVFGNREHWGGVDLELRQFYEDHGVTLLVNQEISIPIRSRMLRIIGMDDFTAGLPSVWGVASATTNASVILIQHSPRWFESPEQQLEIKKRFGNIGLCLSGHMHGEQVVLLGRLFMWLIEGKNYYMSGFYQTSACPLYVSRGIGTSVFPIRFGARPQIDVFNLSPLFPSSEPLYK